MPLEINVLGLLFLTVVIRLFFCPEPFNQPGSGYGNISFRQLFDRPDYLLFLLFVSLSFRQRDCPLDLLVGRSFSHCLLIIFI